MNYTDTSGKSRSIISADLYILCKFAVNRIDSSWFLIYNHINEYNTNDIEVNEMSYIRRHMEDRIADLSKSYGAILLTGPRQSGKTTMLRRLAENNLGRFALESGNRFLIIRPKFEQFLSQSTSI